MRVTIDTKTGDMVRHEDGVGKFLSLYSREGFELLS